MKHISTAAGANAANKNNPSRKSSGSTAYEDAPDQWEDTFLRNLVREALKKGSFVSVCYPYKFAYCLFVTLGYIPRSIAEYYATVDYKQILRIPTLREYMDFMKYNEGDWLWMRGEITACSTYVLYAVVEESMKEFIVQGRKPAKSLREEYLERFYVASKTVFVAVVVTQPFTILSYRQIGQYVGKEDTYSTATAFFSVFTTPGMSSFLGGILLRYVLVLIPTVCGDFAGRTWDNWLAARISCLPYPRKFLLEFTAKGTYFDWLRPALAWLIDVTVYYLVSVVLFPLEIAFVTSCVRDSGIIVGSELFVPPGNFFRRFFTMWRDGKLARSCWYYSPWFTPNMDAFVVL